MFAPSETADVPALTLSTSTTYHSLTRPPRLLDGVKSVCANRNTVVPSDRPELQAVGSLPESRVTRLHPKSKRASISHSQSTNLVPAPIPSSSDATHTKLGHCVPILYRPSLAMHASVTQGPNPNTNLDLCTSLSLTTSLPSLPAQHSTQPHHLTMRAISNSPLSHTSCISLSERLRPPACAPVRPRHASLTKPTKPQPRSRHPFKNPYTPSHRTAEL